MNITKRTKSEGTTVYQFRVFLSQSADGKQRTRSKTWQPPAGMTAKAAEKEAKRQAVIFENEVKQGRAALDARTKLSDVAREYIRNTEMEYKTKEWYEYMLRVVEDDIGNMPISALKAYQIERIYADMREPDAKRTYCVTATELDKIRKEKGIQTFHTVTDLPQSSEHKNGDGYAVGPGTFEQRKAVQFWQHPVQDAGIIVSGFEKMQTIGTCMAAIGGESCCL